MQGHNEHVGETIQWPSWLKQWGWTKVLATPSMFWCKTPNCEARMEVDNDDFWCVHPHNKIWSDWRNH